MSLHVLETRETKYEVKYPDTLKIMNNLTRIYIEQNRWEEAGKLLVQTTEGFKFKPLYANDHEQFCKNIYEPGAVGGGHELTAAGHREFQDRSGPNTLTRWQ